MPTFHYEMAVKPEVYSMPHSLPGEDVSGTEVSPGFEELPEAGASKSEAGSDGSSALEETSMSEAFLGPQEPSDPEFSVPEVEARSRYFPDEYLGQEATEPLLQEGHVPEEEGPPPIALDLLPGLRDPFAGVEAKLARLSSTVAAAQVPLADIPKVPAQVADVAQAAVWEVSGWSSAGDTQVTRHVQMSHLCCPGATAAADSAVALAWWPACGLRCPGPREGRSSVSGSAHWGAEGRRDGGRRLCQGCTCSADRGIPVLGIC